ncbi:Ldh family oxidoreductase [Ruania alba]|uniref:Malate/lactate/ureidoglycolate dehydrogenase, LDH2 family n=1 Tax=Ruania alba TaxID=648782 RepID=A0A1H5BFB3_9MICO|nr:Ldh family oxidoreductase [Ruania alba]SED52948.1 Malate/lactate/ureidoglycolate dehydrogenase, LDH2 family [Ruania alba]
MIVTVEAATRVAADLLESAGVPKDAALLQADLLVVAQAKGVPSHGLLRLPRLLRRIGNGVASATARGEHHWLTPAHLSVDGCQGLGPVVAMSALDAAEPAARRFGIALVSIARTNHLGMLSWYTEQLAKRGLVTIAATTSEALVHAHHGTNAVIGTNPISIAVPADQPVVLDMATSEVSMGKVHDYAARGEPLEEGWALDSSGRPTTDAVAASSGALAPLGPKGYALGVTLGALVAHLTPSATGTAVRGTLDDTESANKGDVFIVVDAAPATPVDAYLDEVRGSRPADPGVPISIPGERSSDRRRAAERDGLEVDDALWNELNDWPRTPQPHL